MKIPETVGRMLCTTIHFTASMVVIGLSDSLRTSKSDPIWSDEIKN